MDPLWAELINSDWRDYRGSGRREDRIQNDLWLGAFVARAGWQGHRLPSQGERERLTRLRAVLRRIVNALCARRPVGPRDLAALNSVLARASWVRRLERGRGQWKASTRPGARGIGQVEAEVVWSLASLLAAGHENRIKVCANPDCGWVLVDESRNGTRRWCDTKECGNLMRVRGFRERRRVRAGS